MAVAREAWPDTPLDEPAFTGFLLERPGFLPIYGGDLALVQRCLRSEPAATVLFEREYLDPLRAIVGALDGSSAVVDDVLQELRLKLVGEGRLAQYGGRGALRGWLRRAALNTAAHLRAQPGREDSLERAPERVVHDPELDFIKERHRRDFNEAFVAALARLEPRERTLLRLNALAGASIDELGDMYRVHRATAARWVQRARERLVARLKDELAARLTLDPEEVLELMHLLRSQLDVSLRALLQGGSTPPAPPT